MAAIVRHKRVTNALDTPLQLALEFVALGALAVTRQVEEFGPAWVLTVPRGLSYVAASHSGER